MLPLTSQLQADQFTRRRGQTVRAGAHARTSKSVATGSFWASRGTIGKAAARLTLAISRSVLASCEQNFCR
jgi:hypothetical protein